MINFKTIIHNSRFIIHKRPSRKRLAIISLVAIVVLVPIIAYTFLNAGKASAAWFNDNWGFRQNVAITNAGSAQTDYQIAITLDTATLITANKMRSDCNDIRITDINGELLPYWIETGTTGAGGKACNASTTQIWTKVPSLPTSGQTVYLYYGNPSAQNAQNGNKVFEFFDDFSGSTINTAKWIVDNSTGFSVSGGTLIGTNTTGRLRSTTSVSTPFLMATRHIVGSFASNGHEILGTYISTSNTFGGFLPHSDTGGYTRNDGGWASFNPAPVTFSSYSVYKVYGADGSNMFVKMEQGANTYTSGAFVNTVSNEPITLGKRYDDGLTGQTYSGTWDWIYVRKYAATEPSVGSPTTEENGSAPVAYWKFDEGQGSVTNDSSSNRNDGTITGAAWKTENQCISGKCLNFDGSSNIVTVTSSPSLNFGTDNFTIEAWVKNFHTGTFDKHVISKKAGENSSTVGWIASLDNRDQGTMSLRFNDGSTANDATPYATGNLSSMFTDNNWRHVAWVVNRSSNTVTFYVDGVNKGSGNLGSHPGTISNSQALTIGGSPQIKVNAGIDEPKIYNYARTAAQIKTDYASRGSVKGVSAQIGGSDINKNLSNGLVGFWKMDEANWSGTLNEVLDSSGNGNNGQAGGATGGKAFASPSGQFGNAGYFDGVDDYVNIGNPSSGVLSFGTGDFTLSAWIKLSSLPSGYASIINKGAGGAAGYGLAIYQSKYTASIQGASGTNQHAYSTTPTVGVWHQLVGVFKRNENIYLYLDGVRILTQAYSSGNTNSVNTNTAFRIGAYGTGGDFFPGKIDEARVYNRALSPAEVSQLYNFTPGPIAYYNFEEGQGSTVNDLSGNSNTGTWNGTGTTHWAQGKYGKGGKFTTANSDYVNLGNPSALNFGTGSFTYGMWVNAKSNIGNFDMSFYKGGASAGDVGFDMELGAAAWTANISDGTTIKSANYAGTGVTNAWVYLTTVVDRQNNLLKTYYNGVLIGSTDISAVTGTLSSATNANIGGKASYYFNGNIDEVKFYNYARTSKQIVSDMNAGHPNVGSPIASQMTYLKFDEGYGNTTKDGGFSKLNATINGNISWASDGKFGKALTFNGVNNYVNWGDISNYDFSTSNYGMSGWIKIPDTPNNAGGCAARYPIFYNFDWGYNVYVNGSRNIIFYRYYDSSHSYSITSNTTLDPNKWYYFAAIEDGNKIYLYINGIKDKELSAPTTTMYYAAGASYQPQIGRGVCGGTTFWYKGQIDEFKIYNSALTADEIKLDYNHGASQVLGALSDTSKLAGGSIASNSASAEYCIPGDASTCSAPVGRWDFNEGNGNTANDTSGNGNTGTWNGTLGNQWKQGKLGWGGNFNGTDNYVNAGTSDVLQITGTDVTAEAWIKTSSNQGGIIARYHTLTPWDGYGMSVGGNTTNGKLGFWYGNGSNWDFSNATVNDNKWHHVVTVFNSSNTKFYIDGILDNTVNKTGTVDINSSGKNAIIGSDSGTGRYINGNIDQVKVFNYARTPAQVAWDYNRGAPVGWWKFDECQGTTAKDLSGNGNNGTITIGATGSQTTVGTCLTPADGTGAWYNGASGKFNASLKFDRTDDYISVNDSGSISLTNNIFTLSSWVYWDGNTTGANYIIDKNSNKYNLALNGGAVGGEATGRPRLYASGFSAVLDADSAISTNVWHHIVGVVDGTNAKIYVDGKLVKSAARTASITSGGNLIIGCYNTCTSSYSFSGKIDDVRIYNYALTANQVKQVMNQGAGVRFGPNAGQP